MANQKFKTKIQADAGIQLTAESAEKALQLDASGNIQSSSITNTELGYLSGVTSLIQTQINGAQSDAEQALLDAGAAQDDIDAHIIDSADAHAASAITNTPSGNLVATTVQGALNELQSELDSATAVVNDVADLITLSGVAANSTTLGTFSGAIIPNSSTIKAALQSVETFIEGLPDPMEYKGLYNATTNSPSLADGAGNNGDVYQVSVAGSQDFGSGTIVFAVGDKVVYNGTLAIYEKWDMTDAVISVNGQNGIVVLDSDDISEGSSNLYHTDERAQDAIGTILTDSDTIDFTYNDATPTIVADVKKQMSISSDSSGLKLLNDSATPGNVKYYGTDGSGVKGFHDVPAVGSAGDIQETSFSAVNNQTTVANVTGLVFANAVVRSFEAIVSVSIDATADLFEQFKLSGIQKGSSWDMSVSAVGDESGLVFTITTAGQVQYVSSNLAGFVSNTVKFRALTTSL
jgi:Tfp pilus assembly protein PilX